jgi:hypothetical protein
VWTAGDTRGGLPDIAAEGKLPGCLATVRRGVPIHDVGLLS